MIYVSSFFVFAFAAAAAAAYRTRFATSRSALQLDDHHADDRPPYRQAACSPYDQPYVKPFNQLDDHLSDGSENVPIVC